MNDIVSDVNQTLAEGAEGGLDFLGSITGQVTAVLIVSLVLSLIICFFGLKLMLIFVTLMGFITGATVGIAAGAQFKAEGVILGVIALVVATIFGMIFCKFYKIGVFLWTFLLAAGTAGLLIKSSTLLMIGICVAIGLVFAVLAVIFVEPLVIFATSTSGGISAGSAIVGLLGMSGNQVLGIGVGIVVALLGIVTQFAMRSREIGKKERKFSQEIKARVSRETEVEKARNMLGSQNETETPMETSKETE